MGRKGSLMPSQGAMRYTNKVVTLREENPGKKRADVASTLRLQHLTRVATCATAAGQIPPLRSMLGQRTAAIAEAEGLLLDSSSLLCQKCETISSPGFNCIIRIKKNIKKAKQCQNNVIYTCHFCRHENLKWGTPKGTVKSLLASTPRKSIDPSPKMLRTSNYNSSNNKWNDFSSVSASDEVGSGSRKRQRKGWTSLKEKAKVDTGEGAKRINRFAIPFKM